jgi:subtilisin family serine protease
MRPFPLRTFGALALAVALPALVGPAAEPPGQPDPDRDLREVRRRLWQFAQDAPGQPARRAVGGESYDVYNLEFRSAADCEAACKGFAGAVHVVARFEQYATVMLRRRNAAEAKREFDAVNSAAGLLWTEPAGEAIVPLPPTAPTKAVEVTPRARPEPIVQGGLPGLASGCGVVIAVIDSGIDFRHPDFIRVGSDGRRTSRLLAVWDTVRPHKPGQGKPGPVLYPGGTPIGTVFTREELTADLDGRALGDLDRHGHGTACAGVAAGSGTALRQDPRRANDPDLPQFDYTGVAPCADLLAVRVGDRDVGNGWLLNCACDWIDRTAGDQPAVISCSFAGQFGGHDGCRIEERWLSRRLPADRPGRLIFMAAGNEGEEEVHGSAEFTRNQDGKLTWTTRVPTEFEVYVDAAPGPVSQGDVRVRLSKDTQAAVGEPYRHPLSGSIVIPIKAKRGDGTLYLSTVTGKPLRADGYLALPRNRLGEKQGGFYGACVSRERQVGSPATAESAVAVGSYDFNPLFLGDRLKEYPKELVDVGKLSRYSNPGCRSRAGPLKPELVAPGQYFTAPAPPAEATGPGVIRDKTGRYQLFNGTSAATPYAAGVAALMLERQPQLTTKLFRELMKDHATHDDWTKPGPDDPPDGWGYGKLDKAAVERLVRAVP